MSLTDEENDPIDHTGAGTFQRLALGYFANICHVMPIANDSRSCLINLITVSSHTEDVDHDSNLGSGSGLLWGRYAR